MELPGQTTSRPVNRLLKTFGIILLLGGLGHTIGVFRFYLTASVPEADRVLLDVWIAEAQLLGGGLFLAACSASRAGKPSRALVFFGALTIIGFTLPLIPVLFSRTPIVFRIPAVIYLLLSIGVLAHGQAGTNALSLGRNAHAEFFAACRANGRPSQFPRSGGL